MRFEGVIGQRMKANLEQWLLPAPYANPGMVYLLPLRNQKPQPEVVPWYGEFPGKYLTAAVPAWRILRDDRLEEAIRFVVEELAAGQQADGYLGPFPSDQALDGYHFHDGKQSQENLWDVWGHYHVMVGLMLWHDASGDPRAWDVLIPMADYLCDAFLSGSKDLAAMNAEEMNMAILHGFALLYQRTENPRYMDMVRYVETCWQREGAGDYVRTALAGVPFYQTPKPRWESLHDILGIAEMYHITGQEDYRRAVLHIWRSILGTDRHNTGGFTSGEQAQGNPYDPRPIETCCTISWMLLCWEVYRLTGDSYAIDELELATYNGMLGAQHPSGRWWTYNTPMDGQRRASAHDIVFQAYPGSPELNCCSVNGPRGLAMLADWAVYPRVEGIDVNYYGPGRMTTSTPKGQSLTLHQETHYPAEGRIRLDISLQQPETFSLRLRIPVWSRQTTLRVNGNALDATAGTYASLHRRWQAGDCIELELDMGLHLWVGEREAAEKASVYFGPVLMAWDRRCNPEDVGEIPAVDAKTMAFEDVSIPGWPAPILAKRLTDGLGTSMVLVDYATAGARGTSYVTWLPMQGLLPPDQDLLTQWIARP